MVYLHDGTFEGILTGIYTMFYSKAAIHEGKLLEASTYQSDLFELTLNIDVDEEKALKVAKSINDTFGQEGFRVILTAFLAEDPQYGTLLFRFLKKAYKLGSKALDALSDVDINAIYKLYIKVSRESHLMLGLLRFSELNSGIFYAEYEPTYNVTGIVAEHFKSRLGDQVWVIHDKKRGIAAFYDKRKVVLNPLTSFSDIEYSVHESAFQEMWQAYVKHIAIKERENPKLQMSHMPKKYWKFLTEKVSTKH